MLSILVHDFKDPSIRNDIYDKQVQPNVKDMLFQIQSVAPFYAHLARLRRKSSLFIPSLKKKKKNELNDSWYKIYHHCRTFGGFNQLHKRKL